MALEKTCECPMLLHWCRIVVYKTALTASFGLTTLLAFILPVEYHAGLIAIGFAQNTFWIWKA